MQTQNAPLYNYLRYRWRLPDAHYSLRHYDYGDPIYMFDDDGSGFFYGLNKMQNIMIEEAKHGGINQINLADNYVADLADRAALRKRTLYCFINVYAYYKSDGTFLNTDEDRDGLSLFDHAEHFVIGVNQKSIDLLGCHMTYMTEYEWVSLNYKMRDLPMDTSLKLCKTFKYNKQFTVLNKGIIYDN